MKRSLSSPTNDKKKRWKQDLPAFLDASSSVSASAFGARRLPELKALLKHQPAIENHHKHVDEAFLSAGHKTSTRHLRRRTTSYQSRKFHRYPTAEKQPKPTTNSRKSRRKPALLREKHSAWRQSDHDNTMIHWLPTHLWHAKRFHMMEHFGWRVPLQHNNRGCRAVTRLLREGRTLVQDVSWRMQPLVVELPNSQSLATLMQRCCPSFRTNQRFGEGILYEVDTFPRRALGPCQWFLKNKDEVQDDCELNIFVHPSIRPPLEEILKELFGSCRSLEGGLTCLALRGSSASDLLTEALQPSSEVNDSQQHLGIDTIELNDKMSSQRSKLPLGLQGNQVILVRHYDSGAPILKGWNLYCSVDTAHDTFLSLVHHRLAVPIGCVEEIKLMLECSPGHVFPVAFPDSKQGEAYYTGTDSRWLTFRAAIESGHGRLPKKLSVSAGLFIQTELEQVTLIVDEIDSGKVEGNNPESVVVVRGIFGQPFVDLLMQCSRTPTTSSANKKRRPRRPTKINRTLPLACRVSLDESQERREQAAALSQSLSLAALIPCRIHVQGRGTLRVGDSIHTFEHSSSSEMVAGLQLGIIVFPGTFSEALGIVRGFGFVGAVRLLKFLRDCHHPALAWDSSAGTMSLMVEVKARNNRALSCQGALSLIL